MQVCTTYVHVKLMTKKWCMCYIAISGVVASEMNMMMTLTVPEPVHYDRIEILFLKSQEKLKR